MGYKMKGSPAKLGTIQGTSGHASALKMTSPNKTWLGDAFRSLTKKGRETNETNKNIKDFKDKTIVGENGKTRDKPNPEEQLEKRVEKKTRKQKRLELKAAKEKGRANRKTEKHQAKLDRANETVAERKERIGARWDKWNKGLDDFMEGYNMTSGQGKSGSGSNEFNANDIVNRLRKYGDKNSQTKAGGHNTQKSKNKTIAYNKDPETATTYEEFLRRSNMSGDADTKKNWSKRQKEKRENKKYGDNIV